VKTARVQEKTLEEVKGRDGEDEFPILTNCDHRDQLAVIPWRLYLQPMMELIGINRR